MGRSEILAFFIIACVLAISLQQAYALKCWTCSSNNKRARNQFCEEPFDESKISSEDRELSYKECSNFPNQIVHCRKLTQTVENNIVYSRSCYWKPTDAPVERCFDAAPPPSFVKNVNCELCNTDGCNGAKNTTNDAPSNMSTETNTDSKGGSSDATKYGPIASLVIIPVAVARSFLLQ